jgi:hypothetical protein
LRAFAGTCRGFGFSYRQQTTLEEGLKKFVAWYRAADPSLRA